MTFWGFCVCSVVQLHTSANAAAAASLHEFAKETFQTWQTAGIFARRRALKALRERAGFRLEQHRIGNYVAKTFDLMNEAQMLLKSYEDELNEQRFKAAAAASLHEFAKDTFAEWQTAGVFMRKRLLKDLRERAGFRLESHRIGNYVAKTYDLMEEARRAYQKAQQACYTNNISYKCSSMFYGRIAELLS